MYINKDKIIPNQEQIIDIGSIISKDHEVTYLWHVAKELAGYIEKVLGENNQNQINLQDQAQKLQISPARLLNAFMGAWEREDHDLSFQAPRLAWIKNPETGKETLCSVFPYQHSFEQSFGPVVVVVPSAITKELWDNLQLHPIAENGQDAAATVLLSTIYSGFTVPQVAEQYQQSCDKKEAATLLEAMSNFSHQDGVWSITLAAQTERNPKGLIRLMTGDDESSVHSVSHVHDRNSTTSTRIARAQTITGLTGGMPTIPWLFAPKLRQGEELARATGFGVLPPSTDIGFLMNDTGKNSIKLELSSELLQQLPLVLRAIGLATHLETSQIEGLRQVIEEEGAEISMMQIVQIALSAT